MRPTAPRSGLVLPGSGRPERPGNGRGAAPLFTGEIVPEPAADDPRDDYLAPQLPEPRPRRSPAALLTLLTIAALTIAAHAVAATFASAWVATASEARFAVAVMAIRDATVTGVSLPAWDHLAAIQIAAVQLVLPSGDPVDTARWACLALGALATLMLWPALRGVANSTSAVAIAVGALGVALPMLMVHSGLTSAVVGVLWLSLAAWLAARDHLRAAAVVALIAVVNVPLVAAMLLAMVAVLITDGTIRLSSSLRVPAAVAAAVAAVGVVLAAVLPGGPFAAPSGPIVATGIAITAVVLVVALVVFAALLDRALLSVLVAALPLAAVGLAPGPSRAAAAVLAAPVLAMAIAVIADYGRVRLVRRPLRLAAVAALVVALALPSAVAVGTQAPDRTPLTAWVLTQTGSDTVVAADVLDRAELQSAGFPAARLRTPTDPLTPGALRLVSDRPGATTVPCPADAALATTSRGTGGAAGVVCGALTPASIAEQPARARLGLQLTGNPSLQLQPQAAAALRNGEVDPRLMLTLAALTGAHRVGVAGFPVVPLDAPGAPRHTVVLSSFDGAAPASSALLRRWLLAQQAPFAPTALTPNGPDLVLGYPAPSPTGLLPI